MSRPNARWITPQHYDREGKPITIEQFSLMVDRQQIAATTLTGDWTVWTVWVGWDQRAFGGPGDPQIFATRVFEGDQRRLELCRTYATEADARDGHDEVVGLLERRLRDLDSKS